MQHFRLGQPIIDENVVTFSATSEHYEVTLSACRKDGKPIAEREARLAYTQVLSLFPQLRTLGGLKVDSMKEPSKEELRDLVVAADDEALADGAAPKQRCRSFPK